VEASSFNAAKSSSRLATISRAVGVSSVLLFVIGPATIHLGLASSYIGFRIFTAGFLFALIAFVLGAIALWSTRAASGRSGRGSARTGFGLGLAVVAVVVGLLAAAGRVPTINDITTNPDDPPEFVAAKRAEANAGRDLSYPGADFAAQQRAGYPDLGPLRLDVPQVVALQRARQVAADLGWRITGRDSVRGSLEATDTSRVFRFVDDVVVRVRIDGARSVLDVRSKSRDGRSDLGANAARIRAFLSAMEKDSG
jgi:uncharacterized protein (DUF1499 family)